MIIEGLVGSLLGGVFRLVPEVLTTLDRKSERAHELAMFDKQLEADKLRSSMEINQIEAHGQMVLDAGGMEALIESIRSQGTLTGVKWVDAVSATVRPFLTYWWCIVLSTAVFAARLNMLLDSGTPVNEAIILLWGPEEIGIVSSIMTFWFLDRVIKKRPI